MHEICMRDTITNIHYVRSSSCSRKIDWHNFIKLTNIRADNVTYFLCTFMTLFPWIIWKSCDEDWVLTENSRQWYILFNSFHHTNDAYLSNHFFIYPSDTFSTRKIFYRIFAYLKVSFCFFFRMYQLKCTPECITWNAHRTWLVSLVFDILYQMKFSQKSLFPLWNRLAFLVFAT